MRCREKILWDRGRSRSARSNLNDDIFCFCFGLLYGQCGQWTQVCPSHPAILPAHGKNHSSVTARQKMAVPSQILFVATSQLMANWFYCKEGCGRRYSVLSLMVRHESTSALPWFSCQFSSHCAQCSDCGRGSSHLCWGEGRRTGCVILCHDCCV